MHSIVGCADLDPVFPHYVQGCTVSSIDVSSCAQGNTVNYYDVGNSLLPHVLSTKKGLPITLCIIHAAVGRRAGLNIGGDSPSCR